MYDENRFKIILVRDQRADCSRGDTSTLNPPLGEPFPFPQNPLPVPAIPGRIANSSGRHNMSHGLNLSRDILYIPSQHGI